MVALTKKKGKKWKSFKLGDILWVLVLVALGLFLIYSLMPLIHGWEVSTLKKQFMGD